MSFRYRFDERKATQVAALFIRKNGGALNYMKLIKLLYLANREAFRRWGRPIVLDGYFSLPYGPILTKVLSLVNEQLSPDAQSYWKDHISAPAAYDVKLERDPGLDNLNRAEIALVSEIFRQYRDMNEWELVRWCHANLSEWADPEGSCLEISPEEILRAVGWTPEDIRTHLAELAQF